MLTNKAKTEFYKWLKKTKHPAWCMMFEGKSEITQNAYFTEWFDTIGITIDVMPRMADENKIVFEPNTFCLKHEIATEDFIQFKTRQEAIKNAIIQANVIYNIHFVDSNQDE